MGITFSGLASGLDTSAIISAILQVEALPIHQLEANKATNNNKISLIGTLEGHVSSLKDKAEELSKLGGFLAYSLSASDESVADFTLSGGAASEGAHTLEITSLAAADRYTFDTSTTVTDPDTDLGSGDIHFTYDGTTYDIAIGSGTGESSLNQIASDINTQAGDAVTASVVNTGTEGSPDYQLVIAGKDTGADFAIGELGQSTIGALDGLTTLTTATNAVAVVDGLVVERSDNIFDDVLGGISFTATGLTSFGEVSFSVDVDSEGVKGNVKEFISAYNSVMSFIETQSEFSEEDGAQSDLFGDSILTTVRSTINDALFNVDIDKVLADTEGYSTLGIVGIELKADGTLEMDETTFDEKIAGNLDALEELFADETDGLMVKLDTAIKEMTKTTSDALGNELLGAFKLKKDTLKTLNNTIDDQIEDLEFNLAQVEATLLQKFTALEELMAGLNAQGQFLNAQLTALQ